MKKIVAIIIIIILIIAGFWLFTRKSQEPTEESMETSQAQTVKFTTADGVEIVGKYYAPELTPLGVVLFLHMMPVTKESWDSSARALQQARVASLAIDLRGHGESVKKGQEQLDYQKFNDAQHQATRLDVEAALSWLQKDQQFSLDTVTIVGASIGANLALQALYEHPEVKKAAALSPGLHYRGIEPLPMVENLKLDQAVLYATSKDDGDNTKETEALYNATKAQKQWKIYDAAGHGTTMLERTDDLLPSIIEFILK
ncbi:MAG: alpha/beta fold hydrolase [Candidatus Portnoybacteria bacterium]|nr:alpha/beta fold hydrolase [Candidatus Portnoybacteria bacterium]